MLSIAQVADELGLSQGTVLGLVHDGELPACDVSRPNNARKHYRISRHDLEAFKAARRVVKERSARKLAVKQYFT